MFTVVLALLSIFQGVRGESNTVCSTEFPGGTEYMCVDWSVGSARMKAAQGSFENTLPAMCSVVRSFYFIDIVI